MSLPCAGIRAALFSFEARKKPEEMEILRSTTAEDVQRTIAKIQTRQDIERTLINWTRIRLFLDKIANLDTMVHTLPEADGCMEVTWGLLKAICSAISQDQKALDILLDAFEELGNVIPVLDEHRDMLHSHPALWRVLELIYRDILQFLEYVLDLSTHPNMRTLFKSMWNDYVPRFRAKLKNMEAQTALLTQISLMSTMRAQVLPPVTMNLEILTGNVYEHVDISGGVNYLGDTLYDPSQLNIEKEQVLAYLRALEEGLDQANARLEAQERSRHDDRYLEIQRWLAAPVPYRDHEHALKTHHEYPSTGLWILRHATVTAWMKDDLPRNPILWIHGIPGAGKTVLASVLIEACSDIENSNTAYFYCKYDDTETLTIIGVLKSLLGQVIKWRSDLTAYFDEQQKQSNELIVSKESTIRKLTELICRGGARTYLVIDGIDECSPEVRKSTLSFLSGLVRENDVNDPGKLRLLVVSQNEPDIKRALNNPDEIPIHRNLNGDDIETYVTSNTQPFVDLGLASEDIELLLARICSYAAGQFLYARLVLEHLSASTSLMELRQELQISRFPRELSEAYERIIHRIKTHLPANQWKTTQQLLGWLTCAARPLKWHEMQGALSIDLVEGTVDFRERSLSKRVEDLCGSLVSVHNDRISLVHMTAQKFIMESEHIDHPLVECQLANLCIRYLNFSCFMNESSHSDLLDYVMEGYYSFSDYAAAKWIHHLYRVAEQAHHLSGPERWTTRELDVNEFLESVKEFNENYGEDLLLAQFPANGHEPDPNSNPDLLRSLLNLLEMSPVGYAGLALRSLWSHAEAFRKGDSQKQHVITLESLRLTIERMREVLERIYSNKLLPETERTQLVTYYGDRPYRCSKTSCFYFHEGFKNADTRNKHVARHDRVYQCSEPDCATADLGFADSKALRAHVLESHPDSETWAKIFKPLMDKKSRTDASSKFRCEKCDLSFTRNAILKDHQRAHAGQKEYVCSRCPKAFVRKWDCTRHERTHETRGNRP